MTRINPWMLSHQPEGVFKHGCFGWKHGCFRWGVAVPPVLLGEDLGITTGRHMKYPQVTSCDSFFGNYSLWIDGLSQDAWFLKAAEKQQRNRRKEWFCQVQQPWSWNVWSNRWDFWRSHCVCCRGGMAECVRKSSGPLWVDRRGLAWFERRVWTELSHFVDILLNRTLTYFSRFYFSHWFSRAKRLQALGELFREATQDERQECLIQTSSKRYPKWGIPLELEMLEKIVGKHFFAGPSQILKL